MCLTISGREMSELVNQSDLTFIADTIPYYPFHGVDRFYDISGLVAHPPAFQVSLMIGCQRLIFSAALY
jgi:hypothetical protein